MRKTGAHDRGGFLKHGYNNNTIVNGLLKSLTETTKGVRSIC